MPIQRFLERSNLGPDDADRLVRAYQQVLHALPLVDRYDPIAEIVAKKVIQIGKRGGTPDEIAERTIKDLGIK
jgi:hypothetical protein